MKLFHVEINAKVFKVKIHLICSVFDSIKNDLNYLITMLRKN